MPVQHSPPSRKTRSQARSQAVLTPTPREPFDETPAVTQLEAHFDRGSVMEGEAPSIQEGRGLRRSSSFSGVVGTFPGISRTTLRGTGEDVAEEEEEPDGNEAAHTPLRESKGTGGPTIAHSN
ncbi:hypothetical protein O181_023051 [Austropuccinia psidii MF-1]|uniref:Uncharacterized protein n=1 Tax=Austropuccinia psidii MF-1 TaxID=1389203 RepID=A0A9Q3CIN0_9BASI|nr:hypothetical protein [Austropuccinia psidii MF-1]